MKRFNKYANLVLASALFVATIPAYSMEVVSTETAPANETVEATETVTTVPVIWYKDAEVLQKLSIAACIGILFYVMARAGNKELAVAESLNVEPVVVENAVAELIATEKTEVLTTTFFNNITMSFKDFGKKVALLLEQYDFTKNSIDTNMISVEELTAQYRASVEQLIAQQYGSK